MDDYAIPGQWAEHAACRGATALMVMPDQGHYRHGRQTRYSLVAQRDVAAALALCAGCDVLEPCRQWALTDPDPTVACIAGGLTPRQRNDIRTQRERRGA